MNSILSNSLKIIATVGLISPLSGLSLPQEEPERLNVLFISVDDLRYQARVFGQREMITPGLDRFADELATFPMLTPPHSGERGTSVPCLSRRNDDVRGAKPEPPILTVEDCRSGLCYNLVTRHSSL